MVILYKHIIITIVIINYNKKKTEDDSRETRNKTPTIFHLPPKQSNKFPREQQRTELVVLTVFFINQTQERQKIQRKDDLIIFFFNSLPRIYMHPPSIYTYLILNNPQITKQQIITHI